MRAPSALGDERDAMHQTMTGGDLELRWAQVERELEPEMLFIGPLTEDEAEEYEAHMAQIEAEKAYHIDQYGLDAWLNYERYEQESWMHHLMLQAGLLTELTRCYLCYLEATGEADMTEHSEKSPLRGIISETTAFQATDPTAAYKLTCGHTII